MDKTEWSSDIIVFLGILLDGRNLTISIPDEKRVLAAELLQDMMSKKKAMVKELQKLCGYLNFLSRAIVPGCTFIRRMYAKYSNVVNLDGAPKNSAQFKMKQHYHVTLDKEFKLDCQIWVHFLSEDLSFVVNRPMTDFKNESSVDIQFFSDASASEKTGSFGAILGNLWLRGDLNTSFLKTCRPSIEYLQLFTLCAGIFAWECDDRLNNKKVCLHCDNQAVVHIVNSMTSGCKNCMILLRLLVLSNLKFNRKIYAQYITSKANFLTDALLHNQMNRFWRLATVGMHKIASPIPHTIWPVERIWIK